MSLEAAMPLVAVSVLAWIMIVLPIVLLLGVGVAYLAGRRRTAADVRRAQEAKRENLRRPSTFERKRPGE